MKRNDEAYLKAAKDLYYDPSDGTLRWNKSMANNKLKMGDIAGCTQSGYIKVTHSYEGKSHSLQAHVLVWFLVYGEMPNGVVDHIDGDGYNNRLGNLRLATYSQNRMNSKVRSDNGSKVTGVYWRADMSKWRAEISYKGKKYHLGFFETKDEAAKARKDAEIEMFGEFACGDRDEVVLPKKKEPTHGFKGVYLHKQSGKFYTREKIDGKWKYYFAETARKAHIERGKRNYEKLQK